MQSAKTKRKRRLTKPAEDDRGDDVAQDAVVVAADCAACVYILIRLARETEGRRRTHAARRGRRRDYIYHRSTRQHV